MKPKSILNRIIILTASAMIMFQMNSCSHFNHQNFQKQKYLKGKLKPVYSEDVQKDIHSIKVDSSRSVQEQLLSENTEREIKVDDPENFVLTDEPTLGDEPITDDHLSEPKKKQSEFVLLGKIKKSPLNKLIIPSKKQSSSSDQAHFNWFIILACLGLIALPFAFLIGFWAFVISLVLFIAAGIILLTGDYDNPFIYFLVIIFFALLCVAAIIGLIWFIIWGIIQLVN